MTNSTTRFTTRVADYVRYRPSYPPALVDALIAACGLAPGATVADIGAGTGIWSKLWLERGFSVYAVEPNAAMRAAAEAALASQPGFHSVAATAEDTTLPEATVACVTAAQAWHWFDATAASREFRRIAEPGGWVALVWNARRDNSPFLAEYDALIARYSSDYVQVNHRNVGADDLAAAFGTDLALLTAPNVQRFDFEGLAGRLLSSSYAPAAGHPQHAPMLTALRELFDRYQADGQVELAYETRAYYGRLENVGG